MLRRAAVLLKYRNKPPVHRVRHIDNRKQNVIYYVRSAGQDYTGGCFPYPVWHKPIRQEKGVVYMQVAILALTLLILVIIDEIIKHIKK